MSEIELKYIHAIIANILFAIGLSVFILSSGGFGKEEVVESFVLAVTFFFGFLGLVVLYSI